MAAGRKVGGFERETKMGERIIMDLRTNPQRESDIEERIVYFS